ncbi:DUF3696 domain-containing protein [Thiothrix subterranea]|uniref:DUF3696 domain-containing protein n=1 Tax=Thiothrix subterranea TaxID=2735563 RepID=A0AA51MR57_9GAMM|nr:DUF3696 domain-containing protein [Thiothrix subterranea]MDQ5767381.1 DUF3696 domain-containing protein [Thiothrix subterranea]WML88758.1 DUF3696 domain-containing protein [Thiothrix subterranea]
MLTHLRIKNFKAWEDTGDIRLAPLTVIFGANSAGKSSMGHLLLALKQTALSVDRRKALHLGLGDTNSLINLGTYEECVHQHDTQKSIGIEMAWNTSNELIAESTQHNSEFKGSKLEINVEFEHAKKNQHTTVKSLSYTLDKNKESELDVTFSKKRKSTNEFELSSKKYPLKRTQGRVWPLYEPEKFYHITEQTRSKFQNASFLGDFALETEATLKNIYYLGPLRGYPERFYQWAGDTPEDVGNKGEKVIAALLAAKNRNLHQKYIKREKQEAKDKKTFSFPHLIAKWLKDIGLIEEFSIHPIAEGRNEHEVLIRTSPNASTVKITDVGFGVSQVLPALVQAFYTPRNSTVLMEQPEIHLHPQVQAGLADAFIEAIHIHEDKIPRNVQLIIESHSEHFLTRLQRRIAEEKIKPEEVAIYFIDNKEGKATIEELCINEYGEIENWPENFFGDEMGDLAAQALAAIERRQRNQAKG